MKGSLSVATGAAAFALLLPSAARAQRQPAPEGVRSEPHQYDSPQNFAMEIRVGVYRPDTDSDPALGGRTPYIDSFGENRRVMIGVELDWQALRIPHLGSIGPGVGVSTSSASRPAYTKSGLPSSEDMSFSVTPFYGLAVLRADVLERDANIPLVPYAKAGLVYSLWHAATSAGTSEAQRPDGSVVKGRGGTWGYQLSLGIALDLGIIDDRSARALDQATGINHTYLFAEWSDSVIDGLFGQPHPMHLGDSTWNTGLAFEF